MVLFDLSGELAGCPIDLVDPRAASTVQQHQVLMHGQRWWARDPEAGLFEAAALSEKTAFDAARACLMADLDSSGMVHGR